MPIPCSPPSPVLRPDRVPSPPVADDEPSGVATRVLARGQATAEYALVLLGVAAIALLLAAWAARSGKIGQLFDAVVDELIAKVG